MNKYNYHDAIADDIRDYAKDRGWKHTLSGVGYDAALDEMMISDAVTGNASGSYTFNAWRAEENICHNFELLKGAAAEFGSEIDLADPEGCDVLIRCYLLPTVWAEVNAELPDPEDPEEEEEE